MCDNGQRSALGLAADEVVDQINRNTSMITGNVDMIAENIRCIDTNRNAIIDSCDSTKRLGAIIESLIDRIESLEQNQEP